jgi:hypothetical protein
MLHEGSVTKNAGCSKAAKWPPLGSLLYLAYGVSFMLNVSSETSGVGAGVLIRAIEPTFGVTIMERNRGAERLRDLARGPGRLCEAWRIDRRLDGIDLCQAARSGSDLTGRRRTKSGGANGSALRAQPTVRCDSTFGAFVRQRSPGAQ